ncbi:MAG: 4Fe-4S dicluster domain-containing protein [Beduini sp.]|uniref:4Fe-4S dicluster domain-containing protein n=1 Tax=Beduini sp. TaxID=1922300 RepID=UPI0011C81904
MRGVYSSITDIRRKIFTEIARMAYNGNYHDLEEIPYKIIPGEIGTYRGSVFLERAIVGERLRLAMGLPLRPIDQHAPLTTGVSESIVAEKYYEPPLINIIKFACHACPDNQVTVTNACQGCLARSCKEVCPKNAISIVDGKSVIDQEKCIKCGLCMKACSYDAIIKLQRPCAKACGMDAIKTDVNGHADIDYDKCVSCGMCLVNCPFGAISDKGQIFQLITSIKNGDKVIAAVAPAFVGQFGPKVTPEKLKGAMRQLGFADVVEVAVGADLCTLDEAEDFLEKVPSKQPFMATSCCPAWSVMAKKLFPEFKPYISMALTPMVLTARMIKKDNPDCKVVFVGPCAAKKLEASRKSVRSDVDFVLTFEEIMGMFEAKDIHLDQLAEQDPFIKATAAGRGFAVSGGVAQAVVDCIHKTHPDREVKVHAEESLQNCRKMLKDAKAGKYDGYLLEGMACPGGCVAGAGTLQSIVRSTTAVNKFKNTTEAKNAADSEYAERLHELLEK